MDHQETTIHTNFVQDILSVHPVAIAPPQSQALIDAIQACISCGQACITCSDACLAEKEVDRLRSVIRSSNDCADICFTTARVLSRITNPNLNVIKAQVTSCLEAVRNCGAQCEDHADEHEHCRVCVDACKACDNALMDYFASL